MFQTSVNLMPVKRAGGVDIWGGGSKLGRNLRKGAGNIGGMGGVHKIRVLATLCQQ